MIAAHKKSDSIPVVVITGLDNYIASFLAEALLLQKCRVIGYEEKAPGCKEYLKTYLKNKNFTFINKDIDKLFLLDIPLDNLYIFDFTQRKDILDKLVLLATKGRRRIISLANSVDTCIQIDYPELHYFLVNDVYGPRMDLNRSDQITQLIKALLKDRSLTAQAPVGYRPVFVADVVYGLVKSMFGLIHQRIIKLDEPKNGWQPSVGFKEGLDLTMKYFQKSLPTKSKKNTSPVKIRKALMTFFICLLLLSAPFIALGLNLGLGVNYFKKSKQSITGGNYVACQANARLSGDYFNRGAVLSGSLYAVSDIFRAGKPAANLKKHFSLGKQGSEILELGCLLAQESTRLFSTLFQNQSMANLNNEIRLDMDKLLTKVSLLETETAGNRLVFGWADPLISQLPIIRKYLLKFNKLLSIYPDLVGEKEPKVYLILLQNSAELRPTGGFIGSYALVSFNQGRLVNLEVKNVYEADGQLKGHIEPPAALKKHLNVANWYLRDSNWSPDFPTSAQKALWFLEKETNQKVDGVIGIDLYLAKRLVGVFKQVKIPEYQETITADNLFEKAEYYAETNFFSGSTQKEDFLAGLTKSLFELIKNASEKELFQLAKAVEDSLESKDLLIYLSDQASAQVLASLNWDGRVQSPDCPATNPCLADFLQIVEANVGVNKANYFVKRYLSQQIEINDAGEISEQLNILYKNNSQTNKFPGGDYQNYLRILVPQGTTLQEVKINNQSLLEENIEQEDIVDKTAFGFLVGVPVKKETAVVIKYRLNRLLNAQGQTRYLFYLQKQPGIEDQEFKLSVIPATQIGVVSAIPQTVIQNQAFSFNRQFNQDLVFELIFNR